jgi:hypothetical protein
MFVRFREVKAERYGRGFREERICAGECKNRPRSYPRYGVGMIVTGRTFLEGCPMKPICPLARPRVRLDVSLVEAHRVDGKVRQRHIASLGSIIGDDLRAREAFWDECDARLARLSNRLGPELDRLRQIIAARIPPLTDADRQALETSAWDFIEENWDDRAKRKARAASQSIEQAKQERREAAKSKAMAEHVKSSRGDKRALEPLNMLLGQILAADAFGRRDIREKAEQEIKALLEKNGRARDVG